MLFESAQKSAQRLGCTVRAIQKWAAEGKIPYAYKDGRDWKIPTTAKKPCDLKVIPCVFTNEPFPIVHTYTPGKISEYIESIEDPDDKNMALCEYYYLTGDLKSSTTLCLR